MANSAADVLVVGGGIMGSATAYYLSRRGLKVFLIDKGDLLDGSTARTGGAVRQQWRGERELTLAIESRKLWEHLSEELDHPTEYVQEGHFFLLDTYSIECATHGEIRRARTAPRPENAPQVRSCAHRPIHRPEGLHYLAASSSPNGRVLRVPQARKALAPLARESARESDSFPSPG